MARICIVCENALTGQQTKFCSVHCKNVKHQTNCYRAQKARAEKRKLHFIAKFGGSCTRCGYSKNTAALCFHHLDRDDKEFGVDARMMSNSSIEKLERELSKCQLLCTNCHSEVHHPECAMS